MVMAPTNAFALADWRRTVAELYTAVRQASTEQQPHAWAQFRAARDELFRSHPQTPLSARQRARFAGLPYYAYESAWRVVGTLDREVEPKTFIVELPADGLLRYTRIARVQFAVEGRQAELSVFWIEGYGGGLFVPCRDATSGAATYGGGRYLYDTIKGADLGAGAERMVLDFNYAYNPSCAYNDTWVCPLAPAENRLPLAVMAGEQVFG
jgi:uncharacterized protein (DUF1684 family)